MIQAIIFDWDGVLVDSEPIFHRVERNLLREALPPGAAVADADIEGAIADMTGMGAREAFEMCRERLGLVLPAASLVEQYLQRMPAAYLAAPLVPGAEHALRRLRPHVRLGVATSSPRVLLDPLSERLEMGPLIDCMVSAEDVPRPKPAPDVYLEASRLLGVPPGSCVAVEDSPAGARAALAAGMRCIAMPRRATLHADFTEVGVHRIIRSLSQLTLEFLEDMDAPPEDTGLAAVLYARCRPQRHERALLFNQIQATAVLALDRGWRLEGRFEDRDTGGPWTQRPGLRLLLQAVEQGGIQRVVVTDPSVLASGVMEQAEIVTALSRWGARVQIVYRREPHVRYPQAISRTSRPGLN